MTFKHAGRQSCLLAYSANFSSESEVFDAGLMTTVFPQASAGAIFQTASISGKFQGVMAPTTPTGSRSV